MCVYVCINKEMKKPGFKTEQETMHERIKERERIGDLISMKNICCFKVPPLSIFQNATLRLSLHWGLCGAYRSGEELSHHHADPVQRRPEGGAAVQQSHTASVAQRQEQGRDVSLHLSLLRASGWLSGLLG